MVPSMFLEPNQQTQQVQLTHSSELGGLVEHHISLALYTRVWSTRYTSRALHLPSTTPPDCYTSRLLHLPSATPPEWHTPRALHLPSTTPPDCYTSRLLHPPTATPPERYTSRVAHPSSTTPPEHYTSRLLHLSSATPPKHYAPPVLSIAPMECYANCIGSTICSIYGPTNASTTPLTSPMLHLSPF
ncbi:hypothetical protein V2G26_019089 [Clonostachys chloroleuca]